MEAKIVDRAMLLRQLHMMHDAAMGESPLGAGSHCIHHEAHLARCMVGHPQQDRQQSSLIGQQVL